MHLPYFLQNVEPLLLPDTSCYVIHYTWHYRTLLLHLHGLRMPEQLPFVQVKLSYKVFPAFQSHFLFGVCGINDTTGPSHDQAQDNVEPSLRTSQ